MYMENLIKLYENQSLNIPINSRMSLKYDKNHKKLKRELNKKLNPILNPHYKHISSF
jgi:hypothetical protein